MHKIFCVIGRSASGKTTLVKEMCKKHNMKMLQSYTTRERRPDDDLEIPDHIFINNNEIPKYIDDVIAYTQIGYNHYFATYSQIKECDFYIIDPNGYNELKLKLKPFDESIKLIPIYIQCDPQIMEQRAIARGQDLESFNERYDNENYRFTMFEYNIPDECFVICNNYEISKTFSAFESFVLDMINE